MSFSFCSSDQTISSDLLTVFGLYVPILNPASEFFFFLMFLLVYVYNIYNKYNNEYNHPGYTYLSILDSFYFPSPLLPLFFIPFPFFQITNYISFELFFLVIIINFLSDLYNFFPSVNFRFGLSLSF